MKAYCVILAGGTGKRMGGNLPKQFLPLKGVPIIVRTIRRVLGCRDFERIVVAIHSDWRTEFEKMLRESDVELARIIITVGGAERHDSIQNALKAIHEYADVAEEDVAVICDAVRPFVSLKILEDSIRMASDCGACVATLPAVDTMLEVENGVVKSVPPRAKLFHGQAPDSARILVLERAIAALTPDERRTITGTAQILVVKGVPVRVIQGDPGNIKITTPADMKMAERYLV